MALCTPDDRTAGECSTQSEGDLRRYGYASGLQGREDENGHISPRLEEMLHFGIVSDVRNAKTVGSPCELEYQSATRLSVILIMPLHPTQIGSCNEWGASMAALRRGNVAGPSSRCSPHAPARSVGSSAHIKIGSVSTRVPTARRLSLPA